MRNHFAETLHRLMKHHPELTLVYGDIGNKLFDPIKKDFPKRAINAGVAESNMITLASGLASSGLIPVTYTISSFHYLKTLEQIKLDASYGGNKIIMVGTGGGLSYSELGTTHHSLEDVAMLGSIPEMNIFLPGDLNELDLVLEKSIELESPSWIRIGKKESQRLESLDAEVSADSSHPLPPRLLAANSDKEHPDVALLATGLCVHACLEAANLLSEQGISCVVWSLPQVAPFPPISDLFGLWEARKIIVVEEHVEYGGLLTRVLHSAAKLGSLKNIYGINAGLSFHKGQGESKSARNNLGFSPSAIAERCLR